MRFVHLAPRSAVGRIRRSGLRLGDGRRGKGVYAVPLFRVRRVSFKDRDDFDAKNIDFSVPLSSATLWRYLFGRSYGRGRRPVAVVFEVPSGHWPVDVYLEVAPASAPALLQGLRRARPKGLEVTPEAMEFLARAAVAGGFCDLRARADGAAAVGALLHHWLASGPSAWPRYDESVEAVIRTPIPGSAIRRLVPLSKTNVQARAQREREKGLSCLVDDA